MTVFVAFISLLLAYSVDCQDQNATTITTTQTYTTPATPTYSTNTTPTTKTSPTYSTNTTPTTKTSPTYSTNTTPTTKTTPTTTTTRPIVVGGHCHYCDLCDSLSTPESRPSSPFLEACYGTNESTVNCMTASIIYVNNKGERSRIDQIRRCFSHGTQECLKEYVGIYPEDGKCFKAIVSSDDLTQYLDCNAAERKKEFQKIIHGVSNQTQTLTNAGSENTIKSSHHNIEGAHHSSNDMKKEYLIKGSSEAFDNTTFSVEFTVCSCTGKLCNIDIEQALEKAEVVKGSAMETNGKTGSKLHSYSILTMMLVTVFLKTLIIF